MMKKMEVGKKLLALSFGLVFYGFVCTKSDSADALYGRPGTDGVPGHLIFICGVTKGCSPECLPDAGVSLVHDYGYGKLDRPRCGAPYECFRLVGGRCQCGTVYRAEWQVLLVYFFAEQVQARLVHWRGRWRYPYGPFKDALGRALVTNDMTTYAKHSWGMTSTRPCLWIRMDKHGYIGEMACVTESS